MSAQNVSLDKPLTNKRMRKLLRIKCDPRTTTEPFNVLPYPFVLELDHARRKPGPADWLGDEKRYGIIKKLPPTFTESEELSEQLVQIVSSAGVMYDGDQYEGAVVVIVIGTPITRLIDCQQVRIMKRNAWRTRYAPLYPIKDCDIDESSLASDIELFPSMFDAVKVAMGLMAQIADTVPAFFLPRKYRVLSMINFLKALLQRYCDNYRKNSPMTFPLSVSLVAQHLDALGEIAEIVEGYNQNLKFYRNPDGFHVPCLNHEKDEIFPPGTQGIPRQMQKSFCNGDGKVSFYRFMVGLRGGRDMPVCGICDQPIGREDPLVNLPCGHMHDLSCFTKFLENKNRIYDSATGCPTCYAMMGTRGNIIIGCRHHLVLDRFVKYVNSGGCERCIVDYDTYFLTSCRGDVRISVDDCTKSFHSRRAQCPLTVESYWPITSKEGRTYRISRTADQPSFSDPSIET
eukprot:GHVH01017482.1.p1 GENE.GHVH01017482.1~~GHVH01017482.1.p1  ORF type:complete len:477 (-),score=29.77 GHVH01017482.1:40-1413(-)